MRVLGTKTSDGREKIDVSKLLFHIVDSLKNNTSSGIHNDRRSDMGPPFYSSNNTLKHNKFRHIVSCRFKSAIYLCIFLKCVCCRCVWHVRQYTSWYTRGIISRRNQSTRCARVYELSTHVSLKFCSTVTHDFSAPLIRHTENMKYVSIIILSGSNTNKHGPFNPPLSSKKTSTNKNNKRSLSLFQDVRTLFLYFNIFNP